MLFLSFRNMRASGQMLMGVFTVLVCAMLGTLLSYVLSIFIYGGYENVTMLYAAQDFNNSTYISLLRFLQVFQSIFVFGIPSFIMAYCYSEKPTEYLYLNAKPHLQGVIYCLLLFLFALPIVNLSGLLNEQLVLPHALSSLEQWMKTSEEFAQYVVQKMVDESATPTWINYIVIAVVPALVEELLFRGALQRIFIKWTASMHWGIWISAAVFSAIHMQFYGFLPRMLLGALFGYVVCCSGSLWISIGLHFINNSFALYLEFYNGSLLFDGQQSPIAPETWHDVSFAYIVLSIVGLAASVYFLQRVRSMNRS
ncbi:MAG: lysostaphin resistance A-like protein [Mangrovibacterium sp.]